MNRTVLESFTNQSQPLRFHIPEETTSGHHVRIDTGQQAPRLLQRGQLRPIVVVTVILVCSKIANHMSTEPRSQGIFGVPLRQSITYANVAISLVDDDGKSYIYGYVPIVVAKCGVFLKEKGTLLWVPFERASGAVA